MNSLRYRVPIIVSGLFLSSTLFAAWSTGWIGSGDTPASTPKSVVDGPLDALQPSLAQTCQSPEVPDSPQAFAGLAGNWANPQRFGTGWTLSFDGAGNNRRLLVTWHTFNAAGNPTWLQSELGAVTTNASTGEEYWTAPLYHSSYSAAANLLTPGDAVGQVWLTFPSSSATHAALRWRWNDVSNIQTYEECIYDFYRGQSRGAQPVANVVNPAYTANWYDQHTEGWGIDIDVGQVNGDKTEMSLFDIFDDVGKPVWLATLQVSAGWPSDSWTSGPALLSKFKYALTANCSDNTNDACRSTTQVGTYARAFTSPDKGVMRLAANNPATGGRPPIVWPPMVWPYAPSADLTGCPSNQTCRPIWRATDKFSVAVAQRSCTVPTNLSQCPIDVSWVAPSGTTPTPKVVRVNATTLVPTDVATGTSGQISDRLDAGMRAYYELRQNATVLATTPIVQAYASEAAATPPSPLVPSIPSEDAASSAVGFTPGMLRVDESGSANYSVAIETPPGRGGLVPKLAVGYSSSAGDGVAGWGANLDGLSVISRCRFSTEAGDTATPAMTMYPDSHGYCLDGQRLIRVSGQEGAKDSVYRTEIDSYQRVVIKTIETWVPNGAGTPITQPTEFEVRGKDGTIRKFGSNGAQRRAQVSETTGSRSKDYIVDWWLASTSDTVGNTVSYAYNEGMANAATNGTIYLTSVSWVGGRIDLDYALRPQPSFSYAAWTARVSLDRWLEAITVRSAQGTALNTYDLQYEAMPQNASLKRLRAIAQCTAIACLEPTVFDWYAPPAPTAVQLVENTTNFRDVRAFKYGDVDGDGRADVISLDRSGGLDISFSRPTSAGITFSAPSNVLTHCRNQPVMGECFEGDNYSRSWSILDFNNDGRDDLLIYTGGAWRVRMSNGTTFAAAGEFVLPNSGAPSGTPNAYVADFTGDGLPDVITYDESVGPNLHAWVMRKSGIASPPYTFDGPYNVRYTLTGSCTLGQLIAFDGGRSEAVDFNGDGRADFAARASAGACSRESAAKSADGTDALPVVNAVTDFVTFTSNGLVNNELVFSGGRKVPDIAADTAGNAVQFGDLNGDGNADILWRSGNRTLYYALGMGENQFTLSQCARVGCPQEPTGKDPQLLDFDGDGRLDLWRLDAYDNYVVNLWTGANQFDATDRATFHHGGDDTWTRGFGDLDGDGYPDNVVMRRTAVGASWKTNRTTDHHKPRNVLKAVGHGLGAVNTIEYSPLTFGTVYQREPDAGSLVSGRGTPVQDVLLPRFVVTRIGTSAPIENAPETMNYTRYRYAGLKMQGGGRGSLGFHRVFTLANSVLSMTEYNQAFPLTGTPKQTLSRPAPANAWSLTYCNDPDSALCMVAGGYSAGLAGVIYTNNVDTWAHRAPSGAVNPVPLTEQGPIKVYRTRSTTVKRDSSPGLLSIEATDFGAYDDYGNLLSSDSRNYADEQMTSQIRRVTTTNVYGVENPTEWILGRLTDSTVTTSRPGVADVSRRTLFNYSAAGLLTSERLQTVAGNDATTLQTNHAYDAYGNETRKTACGGAAGALASCGFVQPSGITFRSSSETQVQRQSRIEFDATGLYPLKNNVLTWTVGSPVDAVGSTEVVESTVMQRDGYGSPTSVLNANGKLVFSATDSFGRKYFEGSNVGEATRITRRWCRSAARPAGVYCPADAGGTYAAYRIETTAAGAPTTWVYRDRLDRDVMTVRVGFGANEFVAARQTYDVRSRKAKASEPYFTFSPDTASVGQANGVAIPSTTTTYDALDRVTRILHPNDAATDIVYAGPESTTTLPANTEGVRETKKQRANLLGEIVTVTDHLGSKIDMGFDAAGNTVTITRTTFSGAIATTTATYDTLGRKTSMSDPDGGAWNYAYNAIGEETRRWSALTCITTRYDARGRVFERNAYANASCSGAADTVTTYDFDWGTNGLGLPASMTNKEPGQPLQRRSYVYDVYGRLLSVGTTLESTPYVQSTSYDQFSRPFQTFFMAGYPNAQYIPLSGELYEYNANGYRSIVRNAMPGLAGPIYTETLALDARGNVYQERRADNPNLVVTHERDEQTGRLSSIVAGDGTLQNLRYTYDALGNLASRSDFSGGVSRVERTHYDGLQRLTSIDTQQSNGAFLPTQGYGYDGFGNLLSGTYDRSKQPLCNAPNEVAPGPGAQTVNGPNQYCFDAIGNSVRTMDPTNLNRQGVATPEKRRLVYAPFNQVREVRVTNPYTTATTKFVYGPERERLRMDEYENVAGTGTPARSVIYIGETEIISTAGSTARDVRRSVGGLVITQRINGDGTVASTKRTYLFTDAQGSTHRLVDSNGAAESGDLQAYTPFGARANPSTGSVLDPIPRFGFNASVTSHGYTGHEQLDKVGIIHMGGRIYDPLIARFLQADPFVQDPNNLQNLNRYSYVNNNPLTYTDPTGYWGQQQQGYLRGAIAIAVAVWSGGAATGSGSFLGLQGGSAALAGGFASGAIATGTLRGAVTGAFTSAVGYGAAGYAAKGYKLRAFVLRSASGGVVEGMNGGSFGHGVVSAGLGAALVPNINVGDTLLTGVAQTIAGGAIAEASGGKFASGALSAAFSMAFDQLVMHAPGTDGPYRKAIWTPEQVAEFEAISAELITKIAKTERLAADMFADAFEALTVKTGFEVGGNVVPTKGGYRLDGIVQGGPTSIEIPRVFGATALVHTHPGDAGDGFSGTLRVIKGNELSPFGSGDYQTMGARGLNGYVYRVGPRQAAWFFNQGAYLSAAHKARANKSDTYAEWFTTKIR